MSNEPFLGLPMPVFTAFGWAGEEQALAYALDQLEQFIQNLHSTMSRELQTLFPHRGLNRETQGAYLARSLETENDLYATFHARTTALRMAIHLHDRMALSKAVEAIQADHATWYAGLRALDDGWELRLQQMEYNPETDEAVNYKDLFKDRVSELAESDSAEFMNRMAYLNSEDKWLGTIELSKRMNSEFVAAMGTGVVGEVAKELEGMMPVLRLLVGGIKAAGKGKKTTGRKAPAKPKSAPTAASEIIEEDLDSFTYVATLKALHLRKGFINLTEAHWPFFSINSRTVTREVTLKYDGNVDKKSAVWRLKTSDKARLVVGDRAANWMEDNFSVDDQVQVTATKLADKSIEIELNAVQ